MKPHAKRSLNLQMAKGQDRGSSTRRAMRLALGQSSGPVKLPQLHLQHLLAALDDCDALLHDLASSPSGNSAPKK